MGDEKGECRVCGMPPVIIPNHAQEYCYACLRVLERYGLPKVWDGETR